MNTLVFRQPHSASCPARSAAAPSPVDDWAAPRPGRFKAVRHHDQCIWSAAHLLNLSAKES